MYIKGVGMTKFSIEESRQSKYDAANNSKEAGAGNGASDQKRKKQYLN